MYVAHLTIYAGDKVMREGWVGTVATAYARYYTPDEFHALPVPVNRNLLDTRGLAESAESTQFHLRGESFGEGYRYVWQIIAGFTLGEAYALWSRRGTREAFNTLLAQLVDIDGDVTRDLVDAGYISVDNLIALLAHTDAVV